MKHTDSLIVTVGAEKSTPKNKMMTQKRGVGVMTDKERREDDALKNLIQAAYDFSDDELLADLEEVEATLSDSDFPGIEERMYRKMMAKLAEEEAADHVLENVEEDSADETEEELTNAEVPNDSEIITETPPVAASAETGNKVVRFGKKKVVVAGILAAAFVSMLGVTAIGGKNYFFRSTPHTIGVKIDNDKNLVTPRSLDEAYSQIKEVLGIEVLKLKYIPQNMELLSLDITEKTAVLVFSYEGKVVYYIQEYLQSEASIGINSDRETLIDTIYNEWISEEFLLEEEFLESREKGYAAVLNLNNIRYRIIGQMERKEIEKIIRNLNY